MSAPGRTLAPDLELEQLRRLTEISRALTYTRSMDQVALLTVGRGAAMVDATAAVLMLADAEGLLQVRASHGVPDERLAGVRATPDEVANRLPELLGVPEDQVLAVPLVAGGAVTGFLAVALSAPGTSADEWLLSALADQAAVALEHARLESEVRPDLEDRLRVSQGATNAKDRALATLAHDIRSPIGAIDGYCWNMEDGLYGPITEAQRHTLGRVRMSGQHLLSLLESVMDMARLNAGTVVTNNAPMDLGDVAREAVEMLMPAATAKLQVLEHASGRRVIVLGDAARIRQVLVNLVGNAVKFTPERGTIGVVTRRVSGADGAWGEVRVTDSGPGIPEEERASVFEPYYRSQSTAKAPGIGLGLAIARSLVEQMGGALTIEDAPGGGSTFTIRLPLPIPRDGAAGRVRAEPPRERRGK
ncbi:MAG TPA: HAMP domain-containing sensor histidine kinase [Gemmatimonadaceae bacterium]